MAILNKPSRKRNPILARDWDDYGHLIAWDDLIDVKFGRHGYAALAWMEGLEVNYADLSFVDGKWEMQNDSHYTVPLETWKRARVKPECDWLVFPGDQQ